MNDTPRARAQDRASWALGAAMVLVLGGCSNGVAEPPPGPTPAPAVGTAGAEAATTAAPAAATPEAADAPPEAPSLPVSAMRSIARSADGCQEWAPGKPPRGVECPAELEAGELLRFLTDTTCARSGAAGREGRVPCPALVGARR
jgi:hypothetical protein